MAVVQFPTVTKRITDKEYNMIWYIPFKSIENDENVTQHAFEAIMLCKKVMENSHSQQYCKCFYKPSLQHTFKNIIRKRLCCNCFSQTVIVLQ